MKKSVTKITPREMLAFGLPRKALNKWMVRVEYTDQEAEARNLETPVHMSFIKGAEAAWLKAGWMN